ncbi:LicD family protein [Microvirga sp. TS319]|uniref:discoidin domain-containing protein n=1 Tax=Microvirga sp. TS319 TaxID=3241165 RepID=UPI00351A0449
MSYLELFAEEARVLRETFFPQLGFNGPSNPLLISGASARYIRLSKPGEAPLAITKFRLFRAARDGYVSIDIPSCSIWIGNPVDGFNFDGQYEALLSGNDPTLLSTAQSGLPIITFDLGQEVKFDRLQICAQIGYSAHHAWGIKIEVSSDGEAWRTHYDGNGRVSEYRRLLLSRAGQGDNPQTAAHRLVFARAIASFFETGVVDPKDVRTEASKFGLSEEHYRSVIKELNARFVHPYEREVTVHGIKRSFRFWSNSEKQGYLRHCNEIIDALSAAGIECSLGYGAVLGLIRGRDFIPHDDDLDIIAIFDQSVAHSFPLALSILSSALAKSKFNVTGNHIAHRWVSKAGVSFFCDVFVGIKEGDFISFLPGPRREIHYADVFPPLKTKIFGHECPIPRNPFAYLEKVYGPHWETPIPGWNHSWKTDDFKDLMGSAA